jgi:hypothetical protein
MTAVSVLMTRTCVVEMEVFQMVASLRGSNTSVLTYGGATTESTGVAQATVRR